MNKFLIHIQIFATCIFVFTGEVIHAQDIHFSQFNQAPARLNPALTGQFKGAYRLAGIYRSQWASVSVPYSTVAFSGDARNFMKQNGLGAGIDFYFDKAGDGNLGTLNFNVSGSYTYKIGPTNKNALSGGLQFGYGQRQIDPSLLLFGDQNGGSGTVESFNPNTNFLNLNTGILWQHTFAPRKILETGIAFHNLTQPNINVYANDNYRLDIRISIHAKYQFKIAQKMDLIPSVLFMRQGPHQQITPGINGKYILDSRSHHYRAVYLGIWTRAGDAGFLSVGMDWNNLNVGLSYDITYSDFNVASRYRGGFELSFIYIFKEALPARQYYKTCPDYI